MYQSDCGGRGDLNYAKLLGCLGASVAQVRLEKL